MALDDLRAQLQYSRDEATALRAGDAYQKDTDWHLEAPDLSGDQT